MIHLFYGNDIDKRRTAYEKLFNKQKSSFFLMNDFDFNKEEFENLIYASGLFVDKYFIILENVLEKDEIKEFILKKLKDLSESNNNFVFIEQSLSKNIVDKFKKYTENIKLFDLPKTIPKGRFHLFDLTDVLGKKDKKGLWILFQKAINSGIIPDEIIGIFIWQIKMIFLVKNEKNYSPQLGIKPFVFAKAKSFSRNFTDAELKNLSSKLITLYHENRRQAGSLEINLEKFILESI